MQALVVATMLGLTYGLVMGTFSGLWDGRTLQFLYSAVKVPMLLIVTFAIALPSFFVLNTLAGVGSDFRLVLRALLATQAGVTVVLVALSPVTFFWYAASTTTRPPSSSTPPPSGWRVSPVRCCSPATTARSRPPPRSIACSAASWLFVYAFVGIQMGWTLRPFIGQPGSPEQFFRDGAWGNAYIELARTSAATSNWSLQSGCSRTP